VLSNAKTITLTISRFSGLTLAPVQRNWDQASELCGVAVQLKPTEIPFHLNLGQVYASAGLREKASDKLDDALELFGEDARLVFASKKEVFNENAEKSSGYIVCSVVSLGSGGFCEHVRGKARVAAEATSRGSFRM